MSGQWEVVGKKKDRGSKLPLPKVINNNEKKKNVLNGVKLEEVLPKSQVQNIYGNSKTNKENKPQEKPKSQESVKKHQKKVDKQQEPQKPKPPKSIESALNLVDKKDFESIFELSKNQFPDAPIVWLKELAQYLNQKVPVETLDPIFSSKPNGYPLSVVPAPVKSVIEKAIKEAGKNNAQLFFDICLTSMATDMSKGLSALGFKFFLQYIAISEPHLVVANINKHAILRTSYQNRSNVGLSILWSVGQTRLTDFRSGLTVFRELMLPVIEMKNYSRFVVKYLLDVVKSDNLTSLTSEEYLLILDNVYSDKKNFPTDLRQELIKELPKLLPLLFAKSSKEKYNNLVEVLLKKIASNSNKSYQKCLCEVLVEIFHRDPITLLNWNKNYAKYIGPSAELLDYISDNYDSVINKLNKNNFKEVLSNMKNSNDQLSHKKRKEDGLYDCIASIKVSEKEY